MRRGTRVGQAYVAVTADGSGINEEIVDSVEGASDDVSKAGDRAGQDYGDRFSDRFRARLSKIRGDVAEALETRMAQAGDIAGERFSKAMSARMEARVDSTRRGITRAFDGDFAESLAATFADRISETLGERMEVLMHQNQDWLNQNMNVSGNTGGTRGPSLPQDDDRFGDTIGSLLGAGSRNNALNLLGKSVGGIINLFQTAGKTVKGFVSTFVDGMDEAGEGASRFARLSSGAGAAGSEALTKLVASGPGAVIAIGTIIVVSTVLVSVLSALLAIVVALSSTIASALVGAAAVGAGALTALAAAGGLAAIAFTSMTDAQQELLKDAFQPLKAELTGIGQLMLQDMVPAFDTWSRNLQDSLFLLAPVAQVMGEAFADAGNTLTAAFSGPGFQAMATALGIYLPSIVRRLSEALGGFLNGAMGLFAALLPSVNRFAAYLDRVGERFSNWANSAEGQNQIEDFVDRAVDSLESLWGFTKEVFGLIGDLLFSPTAQNAGNSMFDSMRETFKDFRADLRRVTENGDLEEWFRNAKDFGEDLWKVMEALGRVFVALDSSGVLDAVGWALLTMAGGLELAAKMAAPLIALFDGELPGAMGATLNSISVVRDALIDLGGVMGWISGQATSMSAATGAVTGGWGAAGVIPIVGTGVTAGTLPGPPTIDYEDLINSGNAALNNTGIDSGGYKPDDYVNPYTEWAQQFIEQGPTVAEQVREAIRSVNAQFQAAIRQAAKAETLGEARSLIAASIESARSVGESMVEGARSAVSSAAQDLASANSSGEAAKALAALRKTQGALTNALKNQDRIEKAMARLDKQKVVSGNRVNRLLSGLTVQNATLADYAAARERLTVKIERANQKLADAIAMRNDYANNVSESIRSFGSLLTAQGKMVDGIEQALTYTDITDNLQDRLDKIRSFQENLRKLLALGLNNDAYKQLVDAGVAQGGAFAEAILAGGQGAVGDINNLTSQITDISKALGLETSSRLYQAGVDAAKGLVDGLESLSSQLDSAAVRLGNSIANSLKKALGITGGGGGKNGNNRVTSDETIVPASARVGAQVSVSPEVAAYAARQGESATTEGDGKSWRDLHVHTPTEDPEAVAREVVNEMTGRL